MRRTSLPECCSAATSTCLIRAFYYCFLPCCSNNSFPILDSAQTQPRLDFYFLALVPPNLSALSDIYFNTSRTVRARHCYACYSCFPTVSLICFFISSHRPRDATWEVTNASFPPTCLYFGPFSSASGCLFWFGPFIPPTSSFIAQTSKIPIPLHSDPRGFFSRTPGI